MWKPPFVSAPRCPLPVPGRIKEGAGDRSPAPFFQIGNRFSVNPLLRLDILDIVGQRVIMHRAIVDFDPAALAARSVLVDVMRGLVRQGGWPGATLLDS